MDNQAPEAYDAPEPGIVYVRLTSTTRSESLRPWRVRELPARTIARHQDSMLAIAVALYSQPAIQEAVRRGTTSDATLHPLQLLTAAEEPLYKMLALSTGESAEDVDAVAYESLPALIAAFVTQNSHFFIDWLRQNLPPQPGDQSA